MQQSEILQFAEQLIPAYQTKDFDQILNHITEGHSPSARLLIKMELKKLMAPCSRSIDLRGRVNGECREYQLNGIQHWLDDVAFNTYQKQIERFGSYTQGVWDIVNNTHNNFRVMRQNGLNPHQENGPKSSFQAEPVQLGYQIQRQENRLNLSSQVEIHLSTGQNIYGVTIDISPSGAKFKVPSAFYYKLGETIQVTYTELSQKLILPGLTNPLEYRVLAVDDSDDNDAVKYLRAIKLSETEVVEQAIRMSLSHPQQKDRHEHQDMIMHTRRRGYEQTFIKHTSQLPLFFSGNELKVALLNQNNLPLWQYWHDERNQQTLSNLFRPERMTHLTRPGIKGGSNTIYAFKYDYKGRTIFFSMMMPEASRELRELFWSIGAKRPSWKVFHLSVFELSSQEQDELATQSLGSNVGALHLTHCAILQEIADEESSGDYQLVTQSALETSELNVFRHSREVTGNLQGIYYDSRSRRREPRYHFETPIEFLSQNAEKIQGISQDVSRHGLSLELETPVIVKVGQPVVISFRHLKEYDPALPLHKVPYHVAWVDPSGRQVQLKMHENQDTRHISAFLQRIIDNNPEKIVLKPEVLPGEDLLTGMQQVLMDKLVCTPVYIEKGRASLRPRVIGVNYPLTGILRLFAQIGDDKKLSLQPIFKNHTNTLLAQPMKHIEGVIPHGQDIYIAVTRSEQGISGVESRLLSEFDCLKQRKLFIRHARQHGDIYILKVWSVPVFDAITTLYRQELSELAKASHYYATRLTKEM